MRRLEERSALRENFMEKQKFFACWLTLNRACNLRCKWCYAKETGFSGKDEMPLPLAKRIIDLCAEGGIPSIILIGGEPTVYPHILDVIRYAAASGIQTTLVTNGILLADKERLRAYLDAGLSKVSLSLKAHDAETYRELTGADGFSSALDAIENLAEAHARFGVSTVLTGENIPQYIEGLKAAKARGAHSFALSFCYNVCMGADAEKYLEKNNPYRLAEAFAASYPTLKEALGETYFSLEQSLPQCVWRDEDIARMQEDGRIHSICQLMAGTGLLFDTEGYLIPCNALYTMRYGKIGENFDDFDGLLTYLKEPSVAELFARLRGAPDEACLSCEKAATCGGGCVTNWTNYSFEELQKLNPKKEID